MSHFHLKYFAQSGRARTNYAARFFSEIEALDAAGLANATRGPETGYYSIEPCRRRACERPRVPGNLSDATRPEEIPRRFAARVGMLN